MPNKLPKDLKNRMEKELRQYWYNVAKIERLEKDIIEETVNSNNEFSKNNIISDSTSQKALKLLSTRSLIVLHERVLYVTKVINRLKPFEKEVFNIIFRDNCDCLYCETMKRYK